MQVQFVPLLEVQTSLVAPLLLLPPVSQSALLNTATACPERPDQQVLLLLQSVQVGLCCVQVVPLLEDQTSLR